MIRSRKRPKVYRRSIRPFWCVTFRKRGVLARFNCQAYTAAEAQNRAIAALGETYLAILTVEQI